MTKLQNEFKDVYFTLNEEQKNVLDEYVKRGKKTKWLNAWAKKIGSVLCEDDLLNPEITMYKLLEWILIDYEDNLFVNNNIKCECGRALRYRYTVLHKPTGKEYKLGVVHFEQHTGLSPEIVRLVTKGLKEIDLERDEILSKVKSNWVIPFSIPLDFIAPKDMTEQLRVNLPLLDRQVKRLKELIDRHKEENKFKKLLNINPGDIYRKLRARTISTKEARDLFEYIKRYSAELPKYGISLSEIRSATQTHLCGLQRCDLRFILVDIEYYIDEKL